MSRSRRLVWVVVACTLNGCLFLAAGDDDDGGGGGGGGGGILPDARPTPDACTPITCASVAANCGSIDDGCGHVLQCGTCSGPAMCAGQGEDNVCAVPLADRPCANDWCWETPAPLPFDATRTFAISATDVWAVGSHGTILHFDGTIWRTVPSNTTADLRNIWMASATDGWVVGDNGTIRRWNGTTWTTVASGTTAALRGVFGLNANDVWIVGANIAKRWTGTMLTTPVATSVPDFIDVFVASTSNVFAIGEGRVWKYGTGAWTAQTSASSGDVLYKIIGTATSAFAIGRSYSFFVGEDLAYQWDGGSTWTSLQHPGDPEYTDIFLEDGTAYAVTDESFLSLPDFTRVVGPGFMEAATGFGGKRFVLGYLGAASHGTPGAWVNDNYGQHTYAIESIGVAGDSVWFGREGEVLEWRDGLVAHDPFTFSLDDAIAIAGTSRSDVYMTTGYSVSHYDGTAWTSVAAPTATTFHTLQMTAAGDLLLVGKKIHRKTATGWEEEPVTSAPAEVEWRASAAQGDDVWVAGNTMGTSPVVAHVARRTNGVWTELPLPDTENVCGIIVNAPDDIWLSGDDANTSGAVGKVSHWNGSTWTTTTRPGTSQLCAIASFGGDLYVSGTPGDIHHRAANGTWTVEPALAVGNIHALRATATDLWAAGDNGQVLRRQ